MVVRKPSWADQFYPENPAKAREMWDEFFGACKADRIKKDIRAIQVPHAGWIYSGQAAAEAYKQIEGRNYRSVIMIGPQHRVPAMHMQVFPEGTWESPLGKLEVDAELTQRFSDFDEAFQLDADSHLPEHSLEVQVPPLFMIQPEVRIVPILTSAYRKEHISILSDALATIVGDDEEILVLISTDLYHGESYVECKASDAVTVKHVEELDGKGLQTSFGQGKASACGADGLVALLEAASRMKITSAHKLAEYNSNDVTGTRGGYVVGYSAFVFT